jgi:two-component sensor histidine kinase
LGTQIVTTLAEGELRGKIDFKSDKTGGTTVALEVPIA